MISASKLPQNLQITLSATFHFFQACRKEQCTVSCVCLSSIQYVCACPVFSLVCACPIFSVVCACPISSLGLVICDTYSLPRLIGQQTATHSLIAPFPPGNLIFLLGCAVLALKEKEEEKKLFT